MKGRKYGKQVEFSKKFTLDDHRVEPEPNTGCWLWTGYVCPEGYGRTTYHPGVLCGVHRGAWIQKNGPVPEGPVLDHVCRVRSCCNPDHLRAVTTQENIFAAGSLALAAIRQVRTACHKCGGPYRHEQSPGHPPTRRCVPCSTKTKTARRRLLRNRARQHMEQP